MFFIFKKEFKDLLNSHKTIFCIILLSVFPYFMKGVKRVEPPVWIEIWLIQMLLGQFIYDSFLLDVKNGGYIFLNNLKCKFVRYFCVKLLFCIIASSIPVFVNLIFIINKLSIFDIGWIILSFIYTGTIMFIFTILFKGQEIGAVFIYSIVTGITVLCLSVSPLIVRFLIVIILDIIFYILSLKISNSVYFRKQI